MNVIYFEGGDIVAENQNNTQAIDQAYGCREYGNDVYAKIMLVSINHQDQQNSFSADAYIKSYVQGGIVHAGGPGVTVVRGRGVSEVNFTVAVNGCFARAYWEVTYSEL